MESPPPLAWAQLLSRSLLTVGTVLMAAGVIDFFAFNWSAMSSAMKLGALEVMVAVAALGSLRTASSPRVRQVALLGASLLVGPLLGVYGQTYQTGADPFELFVGWAVLILPWTLAARLPALWLLEVILFDIGLSLAIVQSARVYQDHFLVAGVAVAGVHVVAVAVYEWLAARGVETARPRWWPRLLTATGLTTLLVPALIFVIDTGHGWRLGTQSGLIEKIAIAMMAVVLAVIALVYRGERRDLFQIVAAISSVIVLVSAWFGRILFEDLHLEKSGFLLLGLAVVAQVGAVVTWLRRQRPLSDQEAS